MRGKSKLSELLAQACAGQEVASTRQGHPVAMLVPVNVPTIRDRANAVRGVRALRERLKLRPGVSLRKLIAEGRD